MIWDYGVKKKNDRWCKKGGRRFSLHSSRFLFILRTVPLPTSLRTILRLCSSPPFLFFFFASGGREPANSRTSKFTNQQSTPTNQQAGRGEWGTLLGAWVAHEGLPPRQPAASTEAKPCALSVIESLVCQSADHQSFGESHSRLGSDGRRGMASAARAMAAEKNENH